MIEAHYKVAKIEPLKYGGVDTKLCKVVCNRVETVGPHAVQITLMYYERPTDIAVGDVLIVNVEKPA